MCLIFLKENKYPNHYQKLIDPKATSDDEVNPAGSVIDGKPVYFNNQQPECSASVEKFIQVLGKEHEASTMQDSTKHWREHK